MVKEIEILNPHNLGMDYILEEIRQCEEEKHRKVKKVEFLDNGDGTATQRFWFEPVGIERLRRVTGYLVGTVDKMNNAKQEEVRDRVKHTTSVPSCDCVKGE